MHIQYFAKSKQVPKKTPKTGVRAYARTPVFGLLQAVSWSPDILVCGYGEVDIAITG